MLVEVIVVLVAAEKALAGAVGVRVATWVVAEAEDEEEDPRASEEGFWEDEDDEEEHEERLVLKAGEVIAGNKLEAIEDMLVLLATPSSA